MARIRTIKPDYWKSEKLAARLPGTDGRQARLLFPGLWNLSEDHGVLRGHPAYVRAEVFPYDDDVTAQDVERWLDLLEAGGFIVRFQRDGASYIWIRGFIEHQRINRPSAPTLPEPSPSDIARLSHESPPMHEGSRTTHGVLSEGSPLEGKGREGKGEWKPEPEREPKAEPLKLAPVPTQPSDDGPSQLQKLWNESAAKSGLPTWRELTKARRAKAKARLRERTLAQWREVIARIAASSFCGGANDRGWKADPDWLLQPDTAAKVLEGKYDDRRPTQGAPSAGPSHRQVLPDGTVIGGAA